MAQIETGIIKPGEMISQTTGRIYPVTDEGLGEMLRDNQTWRKKQKQPKPPKIPFVLS